MPDRCAVHSRKGGLARAHVFGTPERGRNKNEDLQATRHEEATHMGTTFGSFTRSVNAFVSSPQATALAFLLILIWASAGPIFHYSDGWQLIINTGTTIVTFLMVFVLNNAQSRDTNAMNAKLDAIILAIDAADNRVIGLERRNDDESKVVLRELSAALEDAEATIAAGGKKNDDL
jgi:low affinity Fe/Cu permease